MQLQKPLAHDWLHIPVLGEFAVPYFQVPMVMDKSPFAVFGMEAGVGTTSLSLVGFSVAFLIIIFDVLGFGLFVLIVPLLQWKGARFRHKFPIHHVAENETEAVEEVVKS